MVRNKTIRSIRKDQGGDTHFHVYFNDQSGRISLGTDEILCGVPDPDNRFLGYLVAVTETHIYEVNNVVINRASIIHE